MTTVEAAAAVRHRVPVFSQTPQQGRPPPILRTWRIPASQCILVLLSRSGSANLHEEARAVHRLSLVSHMDSVSAPQLCCCSRKADISCASELWGWVPIKLYLRKQAGGQICSAASGLSIPGPTDPGTIGLHNSKWRRSTREARHPNWQGLRLPGFWGLCPLG